MARLLANTNLTRRVLGGVVGVNLILALAVSAGAVPRPGENVQTAAASQTEEVAAPAARQPGDAAVQAAPPAADPTPATAGPATTVATPKVTTPPTTKAPRPAAAPKAAPPAPAVTAAPAAPAPIVAAVTKVARRVPTAAEIQSVVAELKRRVPVLNFVTIAPTQIDQIGDQVCTAFDNGQSFTQVKATGLSMIPATVSVPVGTDDWAVRKAVALYCPGHANKLV